MIRSLVAMALLVSTGPAMAAWELNSEDSKKSWYYAAFEADKSTAVELQFYCDDAYPEDFQILLFTDVDADPDAEYLQDVSVDIVVNGERFSALDGYDDEVDGERVIVVDTLEDGRARDVLAAAENATNPILFSYEGVNRAFGVANIAETLGAFQAGCSR